MRHTLRYQQHDLELTEGEFVIGRASSSQLSLDDPLVSRNHARLQVTPESVVIEDLGSRNGVRVNGEPIRGPCKLSHGDVILIGSQEMKLQARRDAVADTLVQPPTQRGNVFGLLGILADKALGLGRADEAERLVGQQLDELLAALEAGRPVSPDSVERASDIAVRLAGATLNSRWTDFVFRAYAALGRACPLTIVDELYTVLRRVKQPSPNTLRNYLEVLRGLELGPAERFLLSRLEGLERLVSAR